MINNIALVVDKSGSMGSFRSKVVEIFNKNVDTVRENTYRNGQNTSISLFTFNGRVDETFFNADVKTLKRWTDSDYYPSGGTALYDAIDTAICKLSALPQEGDVSNLVIVLTDGEENQSVMRAEILARMIKAKQATDKWTFAIMVPPGYKNALINRLGVYEGNVTEWEISERGMIDVGMRTSCGLDSYYVARSVGKSSVKSFYTDMSNVKPADLKRKLDDIKDDVKVWSVDVGEVDIRSFCEQRSKKAYLKGAAFYALTKSETIQPSKNIIIMEKGKKSVYAGQDARHMLGLPDNGDATVKPGNHANYDIYVQSTSVNRKLVRGTKLVYAPTMVHY